MRIYFILATLSFAMVPCAKANEFRSPSCEAATTTYALVQCREQQTEAANAKLNTYLDAARKQATLVQFDPALIDAEQKAWQAYRDSHCGNLYLRWVSGTIRYEMEANCRLKLTHDRTTDVWRAYLTYADSTPPALPDPSR